MKYDGTTAITERIYALRRIQDFIGRFQRSGRCLDDQCRARIELASAAHHDGLPRIRGLSRTEELHKPKMQFALTMKILDLHLNPGFAEFVEKSGAMALYGA